MQKLVIFFLAILSVSCNLRRIKETNKGDEEDIKELIKILVESYKKIKKQYEKYLEESKSEEILQTFTGVKDFHQSLEMKVNEGIFERAYPRIVKRIVDIIGTSDEIKEKVENKLNLIGKDTTGKWIQDRILFSQKPEEEEELKKSNYTYAAYFTLFGRKDKKTGKVYLYYTTVQTKLKVTKTIFVYKKGNKDVEIRDIELKPEEIDEKDVKLLMAYGDLVSINFFKNYFGVNVKE